MADLILITFDWVPETLRGYLRAGSTLKSLSPCGRGMLSHAMPPARLR